VFKRCQKIPAYTAACFAALVFFGSAPLQADSFDPTRPPLLRNKPRPAPSVKLPKLNPQDYQVTSILLSEQRQVAVINNQVVTVGDAVTAGKTGKALVIKINASEVTLNKARREFVVRLPSSQYIKSAVSRPTEGLKDQP
jgi:hypothetical protein